MLIELPDNEATEALGAKLWQILPATALIFLRGQLGAGKTTLVRGLLRAAGYHGTVKSPTYTLVEEYTVQDRRIYHFDLYRLKDPEELEWMGFREYPDQGICLIEWPEMGAGVLAEPDLEIMLSVTGHGRIAELKSSHPEYKNFV